jgi:ATP-binding cassette subfamily C (CFTR/MRP) protein 1
MQEIIDTTFRDCTVLAVMHRLKHVARYDKVAFLSNGKLLEYDKPKDLIAGDTKFSELYKLNGYLRGGR